MSGFFQEIKPGDQHKNNNPTNCLKDIKYKLGRNINLSHDNFSRFTPDNKMYIKINGIKYDLMECAMKDGNVNNISLLIRYGCFNRKKHLKYLKTLPKETLDIIKPTFEVIIEMRRQQAEAAANLYH